MRVAELGGDVELEVWVVVYFLVSETNDDSITCMENEEERWRDRERREL